MGKIIKIRGLFKNIRDLYILYDTIKKNMPLFLRFITRVSLDGYIVLAIFFLVSLILPPAMGEIRVNDEYLTWQEFWKRGEPLVVLAWASWTLLIPYGVLRKKRWVRPFFIAFPFIQILAVGIVLFVFNNPQSHSFFKNFTTTKDFLWYAIYFLGWIFLATWYLYYKKNVVDFFTVVEHQAGSEIVKN